MTSLITENYYRHFEIERPQFVIDMISEVFNPNNDYWKSQIIKQGRRLFDVLLASFFFS